MSGEIPDTINLDVGGNNVPIARGDLTPEQWQAAQASAAQSPAATLMSGGAPLSASDLPPTIPPGADVSVPPVDVLSPPAGDMPVMPKPGTPEYAAAMTGLTPPPPGWNANGQRDGSNTTPPAAPTPETPAGQFAGEVPSSAIESKVANTPDHTGEIKKIAENQKAAIQADADIKTEGAKAEAQVYQVQQQQLLEQQAKQLETQQRIQQDMASRLAAYDKTISEMQAPAKIDPDRYWNSRSTLQKVVLSIANGFTNGGTMQQVQAAINADIAAQQADFDNNQKYAQSKAGLQYNAYGTARQNGLDEYEAQKAAKATNLDLMANHIQQIQANTTSKSVQANAQSMMAQVDQMRLKNQAELEQAHQAGALAREANRQKMQLEYARLGLEAQKMNQANGKNANGRPMESSQVQRISDLQASLNTVGRYSKEFKDKASGFINRVVTWMPDPLHINPTAAAAYNAKRDVAVQLIGKALEGGVLKEPDMVRYQKMIPEAGDPKGDLKWDALTTEIQSKIDSEVQSAKKAGYNTAEFEKPKAMDDSEAIKRLRAQ